MGQPHEAWPEDITRTFRRPSTVWSVGRSMRKGRVIRVPMFLDEHEKIDGLTADAVHCEAHGLTADRIIEAQQGTW
jgi:hypothetical protein